MISDGMESSKGYFAARESQELVQALEFLITRWSHSIGTSQEGMAAVWHRNLNYYYSNIFYGTGSQSGLEFVGQEGELVKMMVPQARSLNQQFLSLTTKQKLAFDPMAESDDAATLSDTRVAKALSDQVLFEERLDSSGSLMAELASVMGCGFLETSWNMLKGIKRAGDPESGKINFSGYIDVKTLSQFDVIYDVTKQDFYKMDHLMTRNIENRWDLIAQHPDLEEYILRIPSIMTFNDNSIIWNTPFTEDSIFVYKFYHRSSPALPKGRLTVFCDKNTIFYDEENPYKDPKGNAFIPVVQMKPEPVVGTGYGYPFFSNILPLQEMMDHNFSAIASNNSANAVQSVLNPSGNDLSVMDIGGMRFLNYTPSQDPSGGKPEGLQLTKSSPESYKFNDMIRAYMMEIYNVNGALRGEPPPGVTSGTAIATLTTNALEFSQNFTRAYVEAMEICMTYVIWNFALFADEPMVVSIVGENNRSIAKQFIGEDLKNIRRVRVKIANPLMATAAGKMQVADTLMKTGKLNISKYFKLLEGAPIESLYEVELNQETLIQQENDDLRTGKNVEALYTDAHPQHIINHLSLLNDPEVRRNGTFVKLVMDHVLAHRDLAEELAQDPVLLQMMTTGQMPALPPPMPQGMPPQGPPQIEAGGSGGEGDMGMEKPPANPANPAKPLVKDPNAMAMQENGGGQ